jgi:hypothetical protein
MGFARVVLAFAAAAAALAAVNPGAPTTGDPAPDFTVEHGTQR